MFFSFILKFFDLDCVTKFCLFQCAHFQYSPFSETLGIFVYFPLVLYLGVI